MKNVNINAAFVYDKPHNEDVKYKCIKTLPPCSIRGSENYYVWRFNNFMERHVDCNHEPPVYYYGPLETKVEIDTYVDKVDI